MYVINGVSQGAYVARYIDVFAETVYVNDRNTYNIKYVMAKSFCRSVTLYGCNTN